MLVLGSHASAKASCVESNDANNIQWLTLKVNGLALYPYALCLPPLSSSFLSPSLSLPRLHSIFLLRLIFDFKLRYGQFMSKVISDGLIRNIVFKLSSDNSVQAILPHFYVNSGTFYAFVLLSSVTLLCV